MVVTAMIHRGDRSVWLLQRTKKHTTSRFRAPEPRNTPRHEFAPRVSRTEPGSAAAIPGPERRDGSIRLGRKNVICRDYGTLIGENFFAFPKFASLFSIPRRSRDPKALARQDRLTHRGSSRGSCSAIITIIIFFLRYHLKNFL